jgi:hypothetical protein
VSYVFDGDFQGHSEGFWTGNGVTVKVNFRAQTAALLWNATISHIAGRKNFTPNCAEGFVASRETEQVRHNDQYRHGKPYDDRPTWWPEKKNRQSEHQPEL